MKGFLSISWEIQCEMYCLLLYDPWSLGVCCEGEGIVTPVKGIKSVVLQFRC